MMSRLHTPPSLWTTLAITAAATTLLAFHVYLESSLLLLGHDLRAGPAGGPSADERAAWRTEAPAGPALEYEHLAALAPANNWTCVLLHGLGARHASDAYRLRTALLAARPALFAPMAFVVPAAPIRPVAVFPGAPRPAWFDIRDWADPRRDEDVPSLRLNTQRLRHLLARNGVDFSRTIVAGFSQGAVMALLLGLTLDPPPAGIIMLSGYLPMPGDLGALFGRKGGERRGTIVHWLHGAKDGYFPLPAARRGFQQLQDLGLFAPENLAFSSMADLDHAWSAAELELLIRASLDRFLPAPPTPPPA
ncbi:hypothetical protein PTTG_27231 [Puccinia triticina 1-1 BBBD Race 1]|uniref:Acyl-protein thioesterase 1 n=1 Tax=Puccinia triticina (isolate 1-1 / race 1 (BBBD)) TaxID=630390 RepID=A0A180GNB0_PUCT1|nr:hypothetical protein PTTG_27231 [Puccinia triticina 1-1 BBBD Race 1]